MHTTPYQQDGFQVRLAWGRRGARAAADRGDALIVVDVLSFSSSVTTAVERGGFVVPCAPRDDAAALASSLDAELAVHRSQVPSAGHFSLSPRTFVDLEEGTVVVLPSLNGSACADLAGRLPHLAVGCLRNATATARLANGLLAGGATVTVLACGERWKDPADEPLRVALEDLLGAGAILAGIEGVKSPEALAAEHAFRGMAAELPAALWECGSGRELREIGFGGDVSFAAELNASSAVGVLRDGRFGRANR